MSNTICLLSKLKEQPKKLQEIIFKQLFEAIEITKFTEEGQKTYEKNLKQYRDLKNMIDTAYDEGLKAGIEERIKKAIEEGLKKGEEKATLKNIKNGILQGLSNEVLASIMKRDIEYVQQIREQLNNKK